MNSPDLNGTPRPCKTILFAGATEPPAKAMTGRAVCLPAVLFMLNPLGHHAQDTPPQEPSRKAQPRRSRSRICHNRKIAQMRVSGIGIDS